MIAETGFIGSFQSSAAEDGSSSSSYTCATKKKRRTARNCRQRISESSDDDDSAEGVAASNQDQNRPLLHPRNQSVKVRSTRSIEGGRLLCRAFRIVACCLVAVVLMTGLACAVIYYVRTLDSDSESESESETETEPIRTRTEVVGCSRMSVEDVWVVGFPMLATESAFRLLDINGDGVLDVLFGFATGADGFNVPDVVCDIYFSGIRPCFGGLMALDGRTGGELWRHYSPHEVFSINCNIDLDGDSLQDCIIAGRVATFEAVSSRDGRLLWNLNDTGPEIDVMNFYTGQFVHDFNDDGVPDIVNIHGGDPFGEPGSATRLSGNLMIFSGKDGKVLQQVVVPDGRESYYSPVLYQRKDGTQVVLFGTGGETHSGALWMIALNDLYKGRIDKAKKIYSNPLKGIMTPPVLIDLTADGVVDIVFATYNSTVLAFCGETYRKLWNFTYPFSETYATPSPGYYNSDDIPDFIVHWQYGPGFPVYYHSVTTVVDGSTGNTLIKPYIRSSVGAQTSPLTISVEGFGNDIFLYWAADCKDHEGEGGEFSFVAGTNVHEQSRSDFCRLRFKSEGISRMYALSSNVKAPGFVVYESVGRKHVEHQWAVNTSALGLEFLRKHPEYLEEYRKWTRLLASDSHETSHHTHSTSHSKFDHPTPNGSLDSHDDDKDDASSHAMENKNRPYGSLDREMQNHHPDTAAHHGRKAVSHRTLPSSRTRPRPFSYGAVDDDYGYAGQSKGEQGKRKLNSAQETRFRRRRHVGLHDEGGLQRLISTGTLAPSLLDSNHPDYNNSIDVIFATYWFFPAKTQALLPDDKRCIEERMKGQNERFSPSSKYYGMDDDGYEHAVTDECLHKSGHDLPESGTYESQSTYTPYTLNMGQLTVYRLRLKCKCAKVEKDQICGRILPFAKQQWSAYMGSQGNSHWMPRNNV